MTNQTHGLAGQLSSQNIGQHVTLNGWVDVVRDHGQLLFIHLRDHTGIVQVVVDQDNPHYAQSKQRAVERGRRGLRTEMLQRGRAEDEH